MRGWITYIYLKMDRIRILKSKLEIFVVCIILLGYCGGVSVEEDLSLTQKEKAALDKARKRK